MVDQSNDIGVTSAALTDEALSAIGAIVRVCADLEDIINLWICKLNRSAEAASTVILGRSAISTKLNIAESLAKLAGGEVLELHKAAFDDNITRLLHCRNAVAHGILMGHTDEGRYVFGTNSTIGYEDHNLAQRAHAYSSGTLREIADAAKQRVAAMDGLLGLAQLRSRRQWHRLEEIPKGQTKAQSSAKRRRQPQP